MSWVGFTQKQTLRQRFGGKRFVGKVIQGSVGRKSEDVRKEGNKADKEAVVEQVTTCYLGFIPTRISKNQDGTCS